MVTVKILRKDYEEKLNRDFKYWPQELNVQEPCKDVIDYVCHTLPNFPRVIDSSQPLKNRTWKGLTGVTTTFSGTQARPDLLVLPQNFGYERNKLTPPVPVRLLHL